MKKIRALLRKGTEWKEIFHLLPSSSAFFVFFFVAVFTITTCRFANDYESSVIPVVKGRQVGNIPQDELILRDYARKLSLLFNDRNNRQKLYALFRNSPNVSNAVSLIDIGRAFNLKVTYKHAQKVNVSIPWPEHREQFFKDPNSTLYVAYAPLAEDMDVEKIVAFKDGEPVLLDAWEPPDVPVVVLSFEPIVKPHKVKNQVLQSDIPKPHESLQDIIECYPRFVALKVLKVNNKLPEGWWLWPMEIYVIAQMKNGIRSRLPHYIVDSHTEEGWISMWRAERWYWYYTSRVRFSQYCEINEPGLGDPIWCSGYVRRISVYEDDSHIWPNPEFGSDDYWGSRVVTGILPWISELVTNPHDPRLYAGITLWKAGKPSGFFRAYYRCTSAR